MTFLNFTKTSSGFILLFLGLAIIFYSLFSSYNIFTNKTEAPKIFKSENVTERSASDEIPAQIQQLIEDQLKGLLPSDSMTGLLNLISWSVLAGIFIFGGSQVSSLGIKLIK
ncbi:MAG: hypothetical protein ABH805_01315 [Candidatus Nealsonbacteria bacterium]